MIKQCIRKLALGSESLVHLYQLPGLSDICRELLMNSLDAGATRINLHISTTATGSLQVSCWDNNGTFDGQKLYSSGKESAALPSLEGYALRGRALHTIAGLSDHVEITSKSLLSGPMKISMTRQKDGSVSYNTAHLNISSNGTLVKVYGAFSLSDIRQSMVKSSHDEQAIRKTLNYLKLGNPHVEFSYQGFTSNSKYQLVSCRDLFNSFVLIYGVKRAPSSETLLINAEFTLSNTERMFLKGFASPTSEEGSKKHLYVNSFHLAAPCELMSEMSRLFKKKFPKAANVDWVLFLNLPPELVDLNVSYSKDAAIFQDIASIKQFFEEGLFGNKKRSRSMTESSEKSYASNSTSTKSFAIVKPLANKTNLPPDSVFKWQNPVFKKSTINSVPKQITAPPPVSLSKCDLNEFVVIGQVDQKFIACRQGSHLVLMDQHACDERIRLETFLRLYLAPPSATAYHTFKVFDMDGVQRRLLRVYTAQMKYFGFDYWIDSNGIVNVNVIRKIPDVEGNDFLSNLFLSTLKWFDNFLSGPVPSTTHTVPAPILNLLKSKACRGAIMFGDVLSLESCCDIIEKLKKCKYPFICAHGRPSLAPLINII